jgi:hypothetical protein
MRRWLSLLSMRNFATVMAIIMIVVPFRYLAHAAELEGVVVPDTQQVNGKILRLNGFGRRTYSIFGVHIYVASLYLEHFNTNPDEIIRSPETKLLTVRFERSITADRAKQAWRENFEDNCMAPCHLDPGDVERFLSEVPAMHVGDSFYLLFTGNGATVMVNGQQIGTFSKRQFAEVMLATFIGPKANVSNLRQELLRGHS